MNLQVKTGIADDYKRPFIKGVSRYANELLFTLNRIVRAPTLTNFVHGSLCAPTYVPLSLSWRNLTSN